VFERTSDGLIQRAVLSAEGGKEGNEFGSAVAFAETRALVGAWGTYGVAPVSGSAYIFERGPTGWAQAAVLVDPDAGERHLFGFSVALDGATTVVAAPGARAVYVWSRDETGWRDQGRITPDSVPLPPATSVQPGPHDFGRAVAIHGDILVVAAKNETADPGAVYVFRRVNGAWKQEARLEQQEDSFGTAIAVSNETVAVASADSAFVFVHTNGNWNLQARVETHIPDDRTRFRLEPSVSIDGNLMVVGAARSKRNKGAALVFERVGSAWKQIAIISGKDTRSDSFFGRSGDSFGAKRFHSWRGYCCRCGLALLRRIEQRSSIRV
jgi:hypothetical protein